MPFLPSPADAHSLTAIGYCDLSGKSAFKLAIHRHGDRWLLYTGTFWKAGFNIIDVTDPTDPPSLRHVAVDVPAGSMTLQIQIADGVVITSVETVTSVTTGDATQPQSVPSPSEGFSIWSLEDCENPARLGHFSTGGEGTHRNFYAGGRYVYATALPEGYQGHILQIVDISDPAEPVEVARWWHRGQWRAGGEDAAAPGTLLHGGSYVSRDRAYLPYGAGCHGSVVNSRWRTGRPRHLRCANPPDDQQSQLQPAVQPLHRGPHGDPIGGPSARAGQLRDRRGEWRRTTELRRHRRHLRRGGAATGLPVPAPGHLPDAPYHNYYEKGGRFGPHNQHQWQGNDALLHDENLLFLT